jgi:hypothetical protein
LFILSIFGSFLPLSGSFCIRLNFSFFALLLFLLFRSYIFCPFHVFIHFLHSFFHFYF